MRGNNPIGARYYHDKTGRFADEYTVCYHGVRLTPFITTYPHASLSIHPQAPDGVFQHGTQQGSPIDGFGRRADDYKHLGVRVSWRDLPADIQKALLEEAAE